MADTTSLDGELTTPEARPRPGWRWLAAGLVVTMLALLAWACVQRLVALSNRGRLPTSA